MQYQLPELGEGVYEAELVEWRVAVGDSVDVGDTLAEVLTDKATMELPSPFSGKITRLQAASGDTLKIGDAILEYESGDANGDAKQSTAKTEASPAAATPVAKQAAGRSTTTANVKAAPSVRRKARELGVAIEDVAGSGPGGRILLADLTSQQPRTTQQSTREDGFHAGDRVPLKGVRRKIAEQMVRSKSAIPHYGYVDECDVTELVKLRGSLKETLADQGIKLTYLAFFVKAAAAALREFPLVNASLDEEASEIVLHKECNIGLAVSTPSGLIVPVIRNVDTRDIPDIAREIESLSAAARDGKLSIDQLRGGTFTVSSIGGIGGLISTPVINHPEAGILGIGRIVRRPVYDEAEHLRPADLVYLSFSFDHRILDGDIGASFGNAIIRRLQNPAALLVES